MNWLITGGCGFIGTSLIKTIIDRDPASYIRVLDNLSVGSKEDLGKVSSTKGVDLVIGDVTDLDAVKNCCKNINCVVHLAANTGVGPSVDNPGADMENNIIGTFNMLEASRLQSVSRFIFASSNASVGVTEPPIHEEKAPHPASPYGASKLAGEGYCSAYYQTYGLKTIALRFGNVYGPRSKNKGSVVAKFIKLALSGETCEIYGDGTQTRDFIYIDDLVEAIINACAADIGGEVFQIATSKERTVNEVARVLKDSLKKFNIEMNIQHIKIRPGDVKRNYSNTKKAKKLLNWKAKTDFADGIYKTIDYFTRTIPDKLNL